MTEYVKVEFLTDFDKEFLGTDLQKYGPYEEGDVDELPEDNAEILENRYTVKVIEE